MICTYWPYCILHFESSSGNNQIPMPVRIILVNARPIQREWIWQKYNCQISNEYNIPDEIPKYSCSLLYFRMHNHFDRELFRSLSVPTVTVIANATNRGQDYGNKKIQTNHHQAQWRRRAVKHLAPMRDGALLTSLQEFVVHLLYTILIHISRSIDRTQRIYSARIVGHYYQSSQLRPW